MTLEEIKELRHGSWIADRGGKQWQIDCWETPTKVAAKAPTGNIEGFEFEGHPLTEDIEHLQPILLTPEILEACEDVVRTPNADKSDWVVCGLNICYDVDDKTFYLWEYGKFEFKYLHQLQNLVALTKQEIIYKPTIK